MSGDYNICSTVLEAKIKRFEKEEGGGCEGGDLGGNTWRWLESDDTDKDSYGGSWGLMPTFQESAFLAHHLFAFFSSSIKYLIFFSSHSYYSFRLNL